MQPVLTLAGHPVFSDAGLKAVMDALGTDNALMVGGSARAVILGEGMGDIDIACVLTPDVVTARLAAAGIKVVPTGLDHGTVTAVVGKAGYEITTLRRDVETDGRRAVVAYTTDWAEDAQRRDFTMNTLLMDMRGHVYDPLGQGVADLKAGRVRFVGDAATRIAEDALRILRFFRFYARYGKGAPDAEGGKACAAAARNIEKLSRERVTHEIERLLPLPMAGAAITAMREAGIMPDFFSTTFNEKLYNELRSFVVKQAPEVVFPTLFAYSVWENEAQAIDAKLGKYIVFSNAKKLQLKNCIIYATQNTDSFIKSLYINGAGTVLSGGILSSCINGKVVDVSMFENLLHAVRSTPVPVLPLGAADVMAATGLGQGKMLGDTLKKVEAWWLENDARPDRQACLDYVKKIA